MKRLVVICLVAVFFSQTAQSVRAVSDPPLFSCGAPIGASVVSYSSGIHGIPGDTSTHTGSDAVYQVDSAHLLQCFCPENSGSGIQSNWWKVTDFTEDQISYYQKRGWVYVPNGSLWGLESDPYLVKNASYQCHSQGGGNGGDPGIGDPGIGDPGTGGGGSTNAVRSALGSVLGATSLAETGGAFSIVIFLLIGGVFAVIAYRLRRE